MGGEASQIWSARCISLWLSIRLTCAEDDFRCKLNEADVASSFVSVIKTDDEVAIEAGRVLYEYVQHSKFANVLVCSFHWPLLGDGREAFSRMADTESTFNLLSGRNELRYLLLASILYPHGEGLEYRCIPWILMLHLHRTTVPESTRFSVKRIQLLTLLKQFTEELLSDRRNAEGLGRSVEHGRFNQSLTAYLTHTSQGFCGTSTNDLIQFLINETERRKYALDILSALLKNGELTVCHISELTIGYFRWSAKGDQGELKRPYRFYPKNYF